ncbi:Putative competence-damage inducible protein [Anatilimnocola aggregata]|uniref:CinA-like protein n=1 Tax=Anatilimnocola aggregata TaxID=2528021 RepID=A0A517Y5Q6_9BACT|nr:CinA family nicotinamide mononucleotide deamidase-related protein [Anatilimnocola aggregata]QDU25574.1 Putative competence-damage inducible protein [Anatilimnocola aggregata]
MRAEIISIGDEITSGQRVDTNSAWLSQRLGEFGVPVAFHTTVADHLPDNVQAFRLACERADIVIATGGLGPTADDLTRQAVAEMAGVDLVQDEGALEHIRALFARRKREMPASNLVQALFPRGSRVVPNPHGSAPGIDLTLPRAGRESARLFCLPGVPAEMQEMWQATVAPAVVAMLGKPRVIHHYRVKCFGVGESDLEAMLPDLIRRGRTPTVGITVSKATITLRITAEGESVEIARQSMQPTIDVIHQCLGDLVFGYEEEELQHAVVKQLQQRGQTLAVVEWGTAGLIEHWLGECADCAQVFQGGLVLRDAAGISILSSMAAEMASMLGLHAEPTLSVVAQAARERFGSDYALVIGPFPPAVHMSAEPGSVVLAVAGPGGVATRAVPFTGHPDILKPRAAKQALNLLRLAIAGK